MEVYTVSLDKPRGLVAYGTSEDFGEVYNYGEDQPVLRVEGFGDSILFTKLLPNDRVFVASIDGALKIVSPEGETASAQLDEGVVSVDMDDEAVAGLKTGRVAVGTAEGHVFLYDAELEHLNTYGGHKSEVLEVKLIGDRVASMSAHAVLVHDTTGYASLRYGASDRVDFFHHVGGDVFCVARDNRIDIMKNKEKLMEHKIEHEVTGITQLGQTIVICGRFGYLLLIEINSSYPLFKIPVESEISWIAPAGAYDVAFSTFDGRLGHVDIRNANTLRYYEAGVGDIFDFTVAEGVAVVGGSEGLAVFSFDGVRYPLESACVAYNEVEEAPSDYKCDDSES